MKKLFLTILLILPFALTSCLDDNEVDYTEWEKENTDFVTKKMNEKDASGNPLFTRIAPDWAPEAFCLVKWENDRSLTEKNLMPLSNSVTRVKYELELIDGTKISDSYSSTTYGDSIYQSRPNQNIVGFWNCLTNMHVGDSVTCIIPAVSGYGSTAQSSIKPYSTLVYRIKLVSIPAYELPL